MVIKSFSRLSSPTPFLPVRTYYESIHQVLSRRREIGRGEPEVPSQSARRPPRSVARWSAGPPSERVAFTFNLSVSVTVYELQKRCCRSAHAKKRRTGHAHTTMEDVPLRALAPSDLFFLCLDSLLSLLGRVLPPASLYRSSSSEASPHHSSAQSLAVLPASSQRYEPSQLVLATFVTGVCLSQMLIESAKAPMASTKESSPRAAAYVRPCLRNVRAPSRTLAFLLAELTIPASVHVHYPELSLALPPRHRLFPRQPTPNRLSSPLSSSHLTATFPQVPPLRTHLASRRLHRLPGCWRPDGSYHGWALRGSTQAEKDHAGAARAPRLDL